MRVDSKRQGRRRSSPRRDQRATAGCGARPRRLAGRWLARLRPAAAVFDVVFDAVGGATTRTTSIQCIRPGGVIVHISLLNAEGELDVRAMTLQEITFIGSYTYTPNDLRIALGKLHSGALGELGWLEQRPLANGARAFKKLLQGKCPAPKIILKI